MYLGIKPYIMAQALSNGRYEFFYVLVFAFQKGGQAVSVPNQNGGDTVVTYETMMVVFTFGILLISLIGLVIVFIQNMKK